MFKHAIYKNYLPNNRVITTGCGKVWNMKVQTAKMRGVPKFNHSSFNLEQSYRSSETASGGHRISYHTSISSAFNFQWVPIICLLERKHIIWRRISTNIFRMDDVNPRTMKFVFEGTFETQVCAHFIWRDHILADIYSHFYRLSWSVVDVLLVRSIFRMVALYQKDG